MQPFFLRHLSQLLYISFPILPSFCYWFITGSVPFDILLTQLLKYLSSLQNKWWRQTKWIKDTAENGQHSWWCSRFFLQIHSKDKHVIFHISKYTQRLLPLEEFDLLTVVRLHLFFYHTLVLFPRLLYCSKEIWLNWNPLICKPALSFLLVWWLVLYFWLILVNRQHRSFTTRFLELGIHKHPCNL